MIAFAVLLFCLRRWEPGLGGRDAFLLSALFWGILLSAGTEILGAFKNLTPGGCALFWSIIIAGGTFFTLSRKARPAAAAPPLRHLSLPEIAGLCGIAAIVLGTGLTAWQAAPNTWDSLTYHMSRVEHWIQNKTLAPYPTPIVRQIVYPPFAEFVILHFQLLAGNDRWANLVQWFCMAGSLAGISLISKLLGADRRGQILAALLAATLPMGILQSSSTQNDYVLTFALVCFVRYLLPWLRTPRSSGIETLGAGFAAALGILTKGTAWLTVLPLLALGVMPGGRRHPRAAAGFVGLVLISAAVVNSGHALRSFSAPQRDLAKVTELSALSNETFTPQAVLSNLLRNLALQMGTPSAGFNTAIEQAAMKIHSILPISPLDPRTTFGAEEFRILRHPFHEDHASNLVHLALIFSACGLFFKPAVRSLPFLRGYLGGFILLVLLFNILVKWQPWHSRLHLPFFVLMMPFVAVVLEKTAGRKTFTAIGLAAWLCAAPWLVFNPSRPLAGAGNIFQTPRLEQYFANNPGYVYSYLGAVKLAQAHNCRDIGLAFGGDSWEYPLWPLSRHVLGRPVRIEHVLVKNVTSAWAYPLGKFDPCLILDDGNTGETKRIWNNRAYYKEKTFAFLGIYTRDDSGDLAVRLIERHFNNALSRSFEAARLLNEGPAPGQQPSEAIVRAVTLQRQALQEARMVDIVALSGIDADLGDRFQKEFLAGLELFIGGAERGDEKMIHGGQELLIRWQTWLAENISNIREKFPKD